MTFDINLLNLLFCTHCKLPLAVVLDSKEASLLHPLFPVFAQAHVLFHLLSLSLLRPGYTKVFFKYFISNNLRQKI